MNRAAPCFRSDSVRYSLAGIKVGQRVSGQRENLAMNEDQFDGMRVVDAHTGELRYRVRGSRIVDARTGQLAFRIRVNERVVDPMTGQLAFRIRDGARLVDANSGTLRFRLRG